MEQNTPVEQLKGIGPKSKESFYRAGIKTVGELLSYYPRDYKTYEAAVSPGDVREGEVQSVEGTLYQRAESRKWKNKVIISADIGDAGRRIHLTWFHMPYLKNSLHSGETYVFRGKVVRKGSTFTMEQPEVFTEEAYAQVMTALQPVYALTTGLTNKMISKSVRQALSESDIVKEYLPDSIRKQYELAEYNYALPIIHFPKDRTELLFARKRLVFDEFFLFLLAVRNLKEMTQQQKNSFTWNEQPKLDEMMEALPYTLTRAQKKVWMEIKKDMLSEKVMSRLIQGDVGSGKTIIAVFALMLAGLNGYQGAMMAPTEVLAEQHYKTVTGLFSAYGIPLSCVLLTGSMTAKEKREAYEKIAQNNVSVIIGTHALIQEKVVYDRLALVVTDEQHRFGVRQREILAEKGEVPHVLVMSATPIPRTLAIILYGDLDISVIDEVPAERLPIKNCVVDTRFRVKAYQFMEEEVGKGRQVYVICPMVEESEGMDGENVIDYTERLKEALPPSINVEYLHGRMKAKQKKDIMGRFAANDIQILVSTTVVEVGVNVPNASLMMVENAERFGLAQLHQLRGRVGRGEHQSYCIFVTASNSKQTRKRLETLNCSNDGFYIAGEDLKLRGPGDLFGIRQSGLMEFQIGDIYNDASILQAASDAAAELLILDPDFIMEEHQLLKKRMEEYTNRGESAQYC